MSSQLESSEHSYTREFYFISDLHIGGDAELDICDFEAELIIFLRFLETRDKRTELIIVGDFLGMWEMSETSPEDKVRHVISTHKELFRHFKCTGKSIRITVIPGNHDHELACYRHFKEELADYNIRLQPKEHISRTLKGKKIWITHGSQQDSYNRIEHFGNPHDKPIGYHTTNRVIRNAVVHSSFGKEQWLRDMRSVSPDEHIPNWLFSNYFYHEMSPLLRLVILPFVFMFGITILLLLAAFAEWSIFGTHMISFQLTRRLGVFGTLLNMIFIVDIALLIIFTLTLIPLKFLLLDLKRTLRRYGFKAEDNLSAYKEQQHIAHAQDVCRRKRKVALYVHGHTHVPSLHKEEGCVVINTGTWVKQLTRVRSRFRLLPSVFFPSYNLGYFRVYDTKESIVIEYDRIDKEADTSLTLLQWISIFGRRRNMVHRIPPCTIIKIE